MLDRVAPAEVREPAPRDRLDARCDILVDERLVVLTFFMGGFMLAALISLYGSMSCVRDRDDVSWLRARRVRSIDRASRIPLDMDA